MVNSVGDDQKGHIEFHIIADYLIEDLSINLNIGSFALNNHNRLALPGMDHDVGTTVEPVPAVRPLDRYESDRVAQNFIQVGDEVLPDPLLRCKLHKLLPYGVENLPETILFDDPERISGQI